MASDCVQPVRILALDGGGIRGLVQVAILEELEARGGAPIGQLFDLIVGTSTGGVAALHMTYSDPLLSSACAEYRASLERVRKVFAQRSVFSLVARGHACPAGPTNAVAAQSRPARLYPHGAPPRATTDGARLRSESEDGDANAKQHVPHCCVATATRTVEERDAGAWTPYLLRNYARPKAVVTPTGARYSALQGAEDWTVYEQLLATSAAATYFPPVTRTDGSVYTDAAILVNNPAALALSEARCVWPDRPIGMIVSVSCGHPPPVAGPQSADAMTLPYWIRTLIDVAVNTSARTHQDMCETHIPNYTDATGVKPRYVRLDPPLVSDVQVHESDTSVLDAMQADVRRWIADNGDLFADLFA